MLTGGGDCSGLNAVIRSVVRTAILKYGYDVIGFIGGYYGLYNDQYIEMNLKTVSGIFHQGGTILKNSNKDNLFAYKVKDETGKFVKKDVSDVAIANLRKHEVDALIIIGGDGTLTSARDFGRKGVNVVGIPKTIDNDVPATDITFGYRTALDHITDALDALHTTAVLPRPRDDARSDGPQRRLARPRGRHLRLGRRHPHPGDPLRHQEGRREGHRTLRPRLQVLDRLHLRRRPSGRRRRHREEDRRGFPRRDPLRRRRRTARPPAREVRFSDHRPGSPFDEPRLHPARRRLQRLRPRPLHPLRLVRRRHGGQRRLRRRWSRSRTTRWFRSTSSTSSAPA
ncbi:MAG: 6-phosphofructokinase [Bacillus subtilis]|nr:6-phosphofructokinase [Bacillus subtilis]